jgi:hypothetical protein
MIYYLYRKTLQKKFIMYINSFFFFIWNKKLIFNYFISQIKRKIHTWENIDYSLIDVYVCKDTKHVGRQFNTNTISMFTYSRVKYFRINLYYSIFLFHRRDLESAGVTSFCDLTIEDQNIFDKVFSFFQFHFIDSYWYLV